MKKMGRAYVPDVINITQDKNEVQEQNNLVNDEVTMQGITPPTKRSVARKLFEDLEA